MNLAIFYLKQYHIECLVKFGYISDAFEAYNVDAFETCNISVQMLQLLLLDVDSRKKDTKQIHKNIYIVHH